MVKARERDGGKDRGVVVGSAFCVLPATGMCGTRWSGNCQVQTSFVVDLRCRGRISTDVYDDDCFFLSFLCFFPSAFFPRLNVIVDF